MKLELLLVENVGIVACDSFPVGLKMLGIESLSDKYHWIGVSYFDKPHVVHLFEDSNE